MSFIKIIAKFHFYSPACGQLKENEHITIDWNFIHVTWNVFDIWGYWQGISLSKFGYLVSPSRRFNPDCLYFLGPWKNIDMQNNHPQSFRSVKLQLRQRTFSDCQASLLGMVFLWLGTICNSSYGYKGKFAGNVLNKAQNLRILCVPHF